MYSDKISAFISYSHNDARMKEKFMSHAATLRFKYNIEMWHDGCMRAGEHVDQTISQQLRTADIIILLVSSDYVSSHYCIEVELKEAMERYEKNQCVIIPVMLRSVEGLDNLAFGRLSRVPQKHKNIASYRRRDEGYAESVAMIDKVIGDWYELRKNQPQPTKILPKESLHRTGREKITADTVHASGETAACENQNNVSIKLYVNGCLSEYSVPKNIVDDFPIACEKLYNFISKVHKLNDKNFKRYEETKKRGNQWWAKQLRSYLFEFVTYIRRELIGMPGVRIHLRRLEGSVYESIVAVTEENEKSMKVVKLTPIPANNSMISAANNFDAPLIKSLNKDFHHKATHDAKWQDYLTCVFKKLDYGLQPVMTLGISIDEQDYDEKRKLLILLAYARIDNIIQSLLIEYIRRCQRIDDSFDLKSILTSFSN